MSRLVRYPSPRASPRARSKSEARAISGVQASHAIHGRRVSCHSPGLRVSHGYCAAFPWRAGLFRFVSFRLDTLTLTSSPKHQVGGVRFDTPESLGPKKTGPSHRKHRKIGNRSVMSQPTTTGESTRLSETRKCVFSSASPLLTAAAAIIHPLSVFGGFLAHLVGRELNSRALMLAYGVSRGNCSNWGQLLS
ncbi:hypothetical protein N658DRAFT_307531 [Parathielavia hyrcaniae]|uniref:Uncharacterized protein n=1 Tax=Parathielavia hyrcaniae TaxID=113614 RepID=A0AAN6Q9Q8_9PEZI|nr:hypothetical protein N658DRAFT_307531 [Parathielavia hyrcaniae]